MSELSKKSRILRNVAARPHQWLPPDVSNNAVDCEDQDKAHGKAEESAAMTAVQLEEIAAKAHEEGYEQGRREGMEFGHNEALEEGRVKVQERLAQLDQLIQTLEQPFEELDDQVESEIVTLVISMVRQLLRREVKTDPGQIVGVVREALGVLPVSARSVRVVLHPEDADIVREAYALTDGDQTWSIDEDPVIQRGGCRVIAENSQVDATLDSRLNSLIAPLLTAERMKDAGTES